jgi:hypothetical protein
LLFTWLLHSTTECSPRIFFGANRPSWEEIQTLLNERLRPASVNSTQTGAWSLAPASPRTSRSMLAAVSRFAAGALNSR